MREAGVIPTLAPYKCRPVQTLLVPLCARMIQAHPFGIKARREPMDLGGDLGKLGSEPHPGLLGSAKPVTGSDAGTEGGAGKDLLCLSLSLLNKQGTADQRRRLNPHIRHREGF